jgi:hypothetical protein
MRVLGTATAAFTTLRVSVLKSASLVDLEALAKLAAEFADPLLSFSELAF